MNEKLIKWAEKYVPQFNELSKKYKTVYYTQSPLSKVCDNVDLMILGINPKGDKGGVSNYEDVKSFLDGNLTWASRFNPDGTISREWAGDRKKFFPCGRFFLGYPKYKSIDSIDNDSTTVWANFSPFQSNKGFSDLGSEITKLSIESTIELIDILSPKRIVIFGKNGFQDLDKAVKRLSLPNFNIEHDEVIAGLKIGRINGIPTVCVNHPSDHWVYNNSFISMFILLHRLYDVSESGKLQPLKSVKENILKELRVLCKGLSNHFANE